MDLGPQSVDACSQTLNCLQKLLPMIEIGQIGSKADLVRGNSKGSRGGRESFSNFFNIRLSILRRELESKDTL